MVKKMLIVGWPNPKNLNVKIVRWFGVLKAMTVCELWWCNTMTSLVYVYWVIIHNKCSRDFKFCSSKGFFFFQQMNEMRYRVTPVVVLRACCYQQFSNWLRPDSFFFLNARLSRLFPQFFWTLSCEVHMQLSPCESLRRRGFLLFQQIESQSHFINAM